MTLLNLSAVSEALKTYFLPGLRYQLNDQASEFLAQLERNSDNVVGKDIIMALRYGRVGGIGNRADDGDLPTPNSRKTKQAKWETKNIFARFQITDKTIQASRSNVGAFASMLETEIKDCETDSKLDLSRQAMLDGTGKLCTISAVDGTSLTVDSTKFLAEGMLIDIYTTTTKDTSAAEITSVNDATKVIVVSSATGAAQNDVIYLAGNKGVELTGLDAVFDAATLYEIVRADHPWFNAQEIAVDGEISELVIQQAIDDAELKAGAKINYMIGSHGVRRAYQNLLTAQKRNVDIMELKGGYKTLSYNGIPFTADKYAPASKLRLLDLSDWKFYEMTDWNWLDEDGAMLHRVANKAAWEATLVKYGDIGCQKPKGQVELTGVTEH